MHTRVLMVRREETTETEKHVIKKLKRVLGALIGPSEWAPLPSVIGSVEQSSTGKTVIRVGKMTVADPDADGKSWTQTEYVVMAPEELTELIDVLESQQKYRTVKVGDTVGIGCVVMAVQYVNATVDPGRRIGTALTWDNHRREHVVFTVDAYGNVDNGLYRKNEQRALNAYIARLNDHLFRHFNSSPPYITYAPVPERDRLTVTS